MLRKLAFFMALAAVATGVSLYANDVRAQDQDAPAATQQAQAPSGGALEEVMVTARRTEENLQQVPLSVSVFSGPVIQDLNIRDALDMTKLSPGLQISHSDGFARALRFVIRGQGISAGSQVSSVANYFSEVKDFQLEFYDLENLQVLKGPQGTLFGATSTGGAILFTPKKPTETFEFDATTKAGNYGYKSFEGGIGGALIPDTLLARVAVQYQHRDGYITGYPSYAGPRQLADSVDFNNLDWGEVRVSVVWKPFDKFENYTIFAASNYDTNGEGQTLEYANPQYIPTSISSAIPANNPTTAADFLALTGMNPPPGMTWGQALLYIQSRQVALGTRATTFDYDRHRVEQFNGFINTTTWGAFEHVSFKNITGLYWTRTKGATLDTDASDYPILDTLPLVNSSGGLAWSGGWPSRTVSNEAQAIGDLFHDKLKWQAGYFYEESGNRQLQNTGPVILFANLQSSILTAPQCAAYGVSIPCVQTTSGLTFDNGTYLQGTYAVTDDVHLTAGYRYSRNTGYNLSSAGQAVFENVNGIQVPISQAVGPLPGAATLRSNNPSFSAGTYTFAADWQATKDLLLYVTTRSGYKPGGSNGTDPRLPPGNLFYGPEHIKDVEVGTKWDWNFHGIQGRTNLSLYKDWYNDIQRRSLIPGTPLTVVYNLADAHIQGLELEQTVIPSDWLDVSAYFALTDANYTDWLATSTCGVQFYRPQCAGLPASTPVTIDHVRGQLTVNGVVTPFEPDPFNSNSKYRWGFRPTFHLDSWLKGEKVSLSTDIYYKSSYEVQDETTSIVAGNTFSQLTPWGYSVVDPQRMKSQLLVDMRIDWRNIYDTKVSAGFSVTNLTNLDRLDGVSGGITVAGVVSGHQIDPRFWQFELSYKY